MSALKYLLYCEFSRLSHGMNESARWQHHGVRHVSCHDWCLSLGSLFFSAKLVAHFEADFWPQAMHGAAGGSSAGKPLAGGVRSAITGSSSAVAQQSAPAGPSQAAGLRSAAVGPSSAAAASTLAAAGPSPDDGQPPSVQHMLLQRVKEHYPEGRFDIRHCFCLVQKDSM